MLRAMTFVRPSVTLVGCDHLPSDLMVSGVKATRDGVHAQNRSKQRVLRYDWS